jgi:hypothetical protein
MLKQEIQWREPYVSYSLNRKLSGVIPKGVYKGFIVSASEGMTLSIGPDLNDHPISLAVFEYNGYNFSVSSEDTTEITVPNGTSGTVYVVMQSEYINGGGGSTSVVIVSTTNVADNQIILCKLTIPDGTTEITSGMISNAEKSYGDWWKKPPGTLTLETDNSTSGELHTHELSGVASTSTSIIAGNGLVGGGDISTNRTVSVGTPSTCTPSTANEATEDSHTHLVTGVALNSTTISAGAGLIGGGSLSANRTLSLGTPSTCSKSTTNSSSGQTHTHYIESAVFATTANNSDMVDGYDADDFALIADFASQLSPSGYKKFPGNFMIQWGVVTDTGSTTHSFPTPFISAFGMVATPIVDNYSATRSISAYIVSPSTFRVREGDEPSPSMSIFYIAIGTYNN